MSENSGKVSFIQILSLLSCMKETSVKFVLFRSYNWQVFDNFCFKWTPSVITTVIVLIFSVLRSPAGLLNLTKTTGTLGHMMIREEKHKISGLCELFLHFFFFFLQVVIFEPVLCVLLETFPPATYLWSRLRFFWPTNQVKNTVLHVTWGLLRPSSCNTPSCIVLKKKKDCIYYVDHFHVSIVRKICFLLSVIWSFNPRIPRILLLYGLFFRKNKKYQ